ncbi:MAG TPA: hypothetical protein DCS93_04935 [Microscillaceae bacterium]|nr:hypothetical protein [Microscillaceae bacterium]
MIRVKILLLLFYLGIVWSVDAQDTLDLRYQRYNKSINLAKALSDLQANTVNKEMALVLQPVSLANSVFEKNFSSANSTFYQSVDFRNVRFLGKTEQSFNEFWQQVDFSNAAFDSTFAMSFTKFRGNVSFQESSFNGSKNLFSNK